MATNETNPGQWQQTSAGLHMRADASDAGRLARLADVVLWLIEVEGLPRAPAVHRVADQLEAARPAPELFAAQPDNYAQPIEGDAARFGYHTAETWAFKQLVDEVLASMQFEPWRFNLRTIRPPSSLPPEAREYLRKQFDEQSRRARCSEAPKPGVLIEAPGVPALVHMLRCRWVWHTWRGVATDKEALQHPRLPGRTVALRLTDAARIWGYGAAWLPATVTEPTTFAELVAAVKGRNRGTRWSHAEKALLFQEFERRGGWVQKFGLTGSTWSKDARTQAKLASELGLTRNALDRHLEVIRRETDAAPVARVHRMQR